MARYTTSVFALLLVVNALVNVNTAFQWSKGSSPRKTAIKASSATRSIGYVPDGMSPEAYQALKNKERNANRGKDLGRLGPRGFKSRSMQSFQEAMERGEAKHNTPVRNWREKVARGELSLEDIPYMQRGGSWDNSDIFGARKMRWLQSDRDYANGGYKKEQSKSLLGSGPGINWTGEARAESSGGTRSAFPGFS